MNLNELLNKRQISMYRLSKISGVPQSTIMDICNKKTRISKCTGETLYKIAKALDVSIETLIESELNRSARSSFDVFKSNVCHLVKDKGDIDFIIDVLERDEIRALYNKKWYAEAFYLLAMVDYLSRENDVPLCTKYADIRALKLKEPLYPSGVVLADSSMNTDKNRKACYKYAIPEFLRFNIIESEIRNVY